MPRPVLQSGSVGCQQVHQRSMLYERHAPANTYALRQRSPLLHRRRHGSCACMANWQLNLDDLSAKVRNGCRTAVTLGSNSGCMTALKMANTMGYAMPLLFTREVFWQKLECTFSHILAVRSNCVQNNSSHLAGQFLLAQLTL